MSVNDFPENDETFFPDDVRERFQRICRVLNVNCTPSDEDIFLTNEHGHKKTLKSTQFSCIDDTNSVALQSNSSRMALDILDSNAMDVSDIFPTLYVDGETMTDLMKTFKNNDVLGKKLKEKATKQALLEDKLSKIKRNMSGSKNEVGFPNDLLGYKTSVSKNVHKTTNFMKSPTNGQGFKLTPIQLSATNDPHETGNFFENHASKRKENFIADILNIDEMETDDIFGNDKIAQPPKVSNEARNLSDDENSSASLNDILSDSEMIIDDIFSNSVIERPVWKTTLKKEKSASKSHEATEKTVQDEEMIAVIESIMQEFNNFYKKRILKDSPTHASKDSSYQQKMNDLQRKFQKLKSMPNVEASTVDTAVTAISNSIEKSFADLDFSYGDKYVLQKHAEQQPNVSATSKLNESILSPSEMNFHDIFNEDILNDAISLKNFIKMVDFETKDYTKLTPKLITKVIDPKWRTFASGVCRKNILQEFPEENIADTTIPDFSESICSDDDDSLELITTDLFATANEGSEVFTNSDAKHAMPFQQKAMNYIKKLLSSVTTGENVDEITPPGLVGGFNDSKQAESQSVKKNSARTPRRPFNQLFSSGEEDLDDISAPFVDTDESIRYRTAVQEKARKLFPLTSTFDDINAETPPYLVDNAPESDNIESNETKEFYEKLKRRVNLTSTENLDDISASFKSVTDSGFKHAGDKIQSPSKNIFSKFSTAEDIDAISQPSLAFSTGKQTGNNIFSKFSTAENIDAISQPSLVISTGKEAGNQTSTSHDDIRKLMKRINASAPEDLNDISVPFSTTLKRTEDSSAFSTSFRSAYSTSEKNISRFGFRRDIEKLLDRLNLESVPNLSDISAPFLSAIDSDQDSTDSRDDTSFHRKTIQQAKKLFENLSKVENIEAVTPPKYFDDSNVSDHLNKPSLGDSDLMEKLLKKINARSISNLSDISAPFTNDSDNFTRDATKSGNVTPYRKYSPKHPKKIFSSLSKNSNIGDITPPEFVNSVKSSDYALSTEGKSNSKNPLYKTKLFPLLEENVEDISPPDLMKDDSQRSQKKPLLLNSRTSRREQHTNAKLSDRPHKELIARINDSYTEDLNEISDPFGNTISKTENIEDISAPKLVDSLTPSRSMRKSLKPESRDAIAKLFKKIKSSFVQNLSEISAPFADETENSSGIAYNTPILKRSSRQPKLLPTEFPEENIMDITRPSLMESTASTANRSIHRGKNTSNKLKPKTTDVYKNLLERGNKSYVNNLVDESTPFIDESGISTKLEDTAPSRKPKLPTNTFSDEDIMEITPPSLMKSMRKNGQLTSNDINAYKKFQDLFGKVNENHAEHLDDISAPFVDESGTSIKYAHNTPLEKKVARRPNLLKISFSNEDIADITPPSLISSSINCSATRVRNGSSNSKLRRDAASYNITNERKQLLQKIDESNIENLNDVLDPFTDSIESSNPSNKTPVRRNLAQLYSKLFSVSSPAEDIAAISPPKLMNNPRNRKRADQSDLKTEPKLLGSSITKLGGRPRTDEKSANPLYKISKILSDVENLYEVTPPFFNESD